ncbi:MAG: EamA family transporter [Bacteroidota bacterium]|nr:EamA family transporter [Candidatus Kapabacteria bacterium]MDW8219985.1 EamA family transporter [Bacteroidota bacterium]
MRHHTCALLTLTITAVLWSTGGVCIKLVAWDVLSIAGMRSAVAAIVIACMVPPRVRFPQHMTRYEVGAAIAYTLVMITFVAATKLTTAANAILLQYTAPIYVALFSSWFLKEPVQRRDWVALGVVCIGMVVFFCDSLAPSYAVGNILAIASGVSFAWLVLFMRKHSYVNARNSLVSSDGVFWGNVVTACVCMPAVIYSLASGFIPSLQTLLGVVLLGVFQIGVPYALYARAIPHVSALEAILFPILEPVLNPLWVALVIGEMPSIWSLLGGSIVIAAVTIRSIVASPNQRSVHG